MVSDPSAPDPLAAIAKARGTARLIVTTTPGVTMTVLAQEDLVDAIAAALAREADGRANELAYWKAAEAAREEERRQADEARVRAEGERDGIDALWLKARFDAVDAHQRIAALEAALRGARQRVDEYDNLLCWCRHLRMFADSVHDHGCRSARAALAPPERSRVAAAPEPPR